MEYIKIIIIIMEYIIMAISTSKLQISQNATVYRRGRERGGGGQGL